MFVLRAVSVCLSVCLRQVIFLPGKARACIFYVCRYGSYGSYEPRTYKRAHVRAFFMYVGTLRRYGSYELCTYLCRKCKRYGFVRTLNG